MKPARTRQCVVDDDEAASGDATHLAQHAKPHAARHVVEREGQTDRVERALGEPERACVEVERAGVGAEPFGQPPLCGLPPQCGGPAVVGRVHVAEPGREGDLVRPFDPHAPAVAPRDRGRRRQPGDLDGPVAWGLGPVRQHADGCSERRHQHEDDAEGEEQTGQGERGGGGKLTEVRSYSHVASALPRDEG